MHKLTILSGVEIDAVADLQTEITIPESVQRAMQHTEMVLLVFFISAKTGSPIVDIDPQVQKTRVDSSNTTFWSKISKGTGVADYVQLNIDTPSANDYAEWWVGYCADETGSVHHERTGRRIRPRNDAARERSGDARRVPLPAILTRNRGVAHPGRIRPGIECRPTDQWATGRCHRPRPRADPHGLRIVLPDAANCG